MLKSFMISSIVTCAALCAAASAHAADVTQPVKAVMDMTVANWADNATEMQDLFADQRLSSLYSKDFVAKYKAASKFPAYDGGDSPFDYDVITSGQDGCPLKDMAIAPQPPKGAVTTVVVKFNNTACFGSEPEYNALQEVRFDMIDEGGKAVIDDVHTSLGDNEFGSLKADMEAIAAQ